VKTKILVTAVTLLASAMILAGNYAAQADDKHDDSDQAAFKKNTLVLSRSEYAGTAATVTVGQTLPPGCVAKTVQVSVLPAFLAANGGAATTPVAVSCGIAIANGTYPGVFENDTPDGSFGVTSPIFLDNITTDGELLHTLPVDPSRIVTSFSSKSELALNLSLDKKSITFVAYVGGPGFVTGANQLDVSNSNTPGVVDPTNPVVSQYYRSVAEVDASGHIGITDGNAYSGNNGRAAIKAGWIYYITGNDNNGGLTTPNKKGVPPIDQLDGTPVGVNLITSTGAELLIPGQTPPSPPDIAMIGRFSISQVTDPGSCVPGPCKNYAADKPGKDTNYRGLTIHNNTLYVTKGSGGNGINTVYQVGNAGSLPTGSETVLAALPITVLPGFPTGLASGTDPATGAATPIAFPFGIWFANSDTLYVCDEGDGTLAPAVNGNVASTYSQQFSGVQKWHFDGTKWSMLYVLNNGLNIGVPYNPPNNPAVGGYPLPATDGCRNLTGEVSDDGVATIYAVTSTVSTAGDQGADPNKLVQVSDKVSATTLPAGDGDHDADDKLGVVTTIRQASFGEVLRGVAFAPQDRDDDDQGR